MVILNQNQKQHPHHMESDHLLFFFTQPMVEGGAVIDSVPFVHSYIDW